MVDHSVSIEDFTLLSVIGKGSYGKVLLVRKNNTGEMLAMKMLRKDFIARRNQIEHTRTERSVLERVNHPYIVKLKYAFQSPKKLYFVLEYCPGGELFFHLSRAQRFDEPRATFYAACMVLAIEHLHSLNIVYRDLKPENILIDAEGYAKITDFGLSKENIVDNTGAQSFCGTPEYLAPEILAKQGHGKAVDWWSLGALIFEMLTGLPPFYTRDREKLFNSILHEDINFPSYLSNNAKDLLQRLFVKDPSQRLGCGPNDSEPIKSHPFFESINWGALLRKEMRPPFLPNLSNEHGLNNFEDEFKKMPAVDSVGKDSRLQGAASPTYQGFSYVNEGMPDQ
ncbi:unnamed protein product [Blepharisma stoltei]|uniref:non-specific serine/threonine protein kinase n=1 Tax=Blepharisma stoltei TaxID=1481888 RepID=A0AAU9JZM9_9CILI|nr:unnamed protein product [Blepharisma stoltei]